MSSVTEETAVKAQSLDQYLPKALSPFTSLGHLEYWGHFCAQVLITRNTLKTSDPDF
jgi:hypothetical protein